MFFIERVSGSWPQLPTRITLLIPRAMICPHSKTYFINDNIYESGAKLHHINRYPLQIRVFTFGDDETAHQCLKACRHYLEALAAH